MESLEYQLVKKQEFEYIKEKYLDPLSNNKELNERCNDTGSDRERIDGEFQRDYTRILYSSSFRRLQGKMQLLGIKQDQFFRNRLTHSLEVAQIARSIANRIGYSIEESYIVEAGSLAHDIGNPPYGHAGERFLNQLAKEFGGFEGNAQTLRILTTVEQKRPNFQGLNLTYRTLFSVIKYNNRFNKDLIGKEFNKQKFLYEEDRDFINKISEKFGIHARTLDVQIVDLADEIAYAAHDLEDGLRQSLFTADEIILEFDNLCREEKEYDGKLTNKLEEMIFDSKKKAGLDNSYGVTKKFFMDSSQYSKLFRKEVASRVINTLIKDIGLVKVSDEKKRRTGTVNDEELGFLKYSKLASGLKRTTYNCINHNDEVYIYEEKGCKIIQFLYEFYSNEKNYHYLPPEYRAEFRAKQYRLKNDENLQKRLIIDYISGMMDTYAETSYEKLKKINNYFSIQDYCPVIKTSISEAACASEKTIAGQNE